MQTDRQQLQCSFCHKLGHSVQMCHKKRDSHTWNNSTSNSTTHINSQHNNSKINNNSTNYSNHTQLLRPTTPTTANTTTTTNQRGSLTCYNCCKPGHTKYNCPNRKQGDARGQQTRVVVSSSVDGITPSVRADKGSVYSGVTPIPTSGITSFPASVGGDGNGRLQYI